MVVGAVKIDSALVGANQFSATGTFGISDCPAVSSYGPLWDVGPGTAVFDMGSCELGLSTSSAACTDRLFVTPEVYGGFSVPNPLTLRMAGSVVGTSMAAPRSGRRRLCRGRVHG